MSKQLHHVGIVVKDVEEALNQYINMLGVTPWQKGIVEVREVGLRLAHIDIGEGASIELMEPTNAENRQARFLRERGEGLFHINLFTDNFGGDVKELREKGLTVEIEEDKEAFPGYMLRMAWLQPKDTRGLWIELADSSSVPPDQRQQIGWSQ